MNISKYFRTPVNHEKFLREDEDLGVPEFDESVEILCRIEGEMRFRTSDNQTAIYDTLVYYTKAEVKPRDRIDGYPVISSRPVYDIRGRLSHYECAVGRA